MAKARHLAMLALLGASVAGCSLLKPVERPSLPDDCVWVEFPYGFVCLEWQTLPIGDSSLGKDLPPTTGRVTGMKTGSLP